MQLHITINEKSQRSPDDSVIVIMKTADIFGFTFHVDTNGIFYLVSHIPSDKMHLNQRSKLSIRNLRVVSVLPAIYIYIYIYKVGDLSRGRPEGSLFN